MRAIIVFFSLIMSTNTLASWTEKHGTYTTQAIKPDGTPFIGAPTLQLSSNFSGKPELYLSYFGDSDFFSTYCKGKENVSNGTDTTLAFNYKPLKLTYSCAFGNMQSVTFFTQEQDALVSIFKKSKERVVVVTESFDFQYSAIGFTKIFSEATSKAEKAGKVRLNKEMKRNTWSPEEAATMGYNKYGHSDFKLPRAEIFLTQSGTVGFGLMYGLFAGGQEANKYCSNDSPKSTRFKLPSAIINNTKVRMIGYCEKYADVNGYYLMAYPESAKGRQYVIGEFITKPFVNINNAYYSASNFSTTYNELLSSTEGI